MKFIYIHGLNGSSESFIAKQLKEVIPEIITPNMPNNPTEWINYILSMFTSDEMVTIIGNSTGGLFANYVGDTYGINTVLINPVIDADDLSRFIGENINGLTGQRWILTPTDIKSLKMFEIEKTETPTIIFLGRDDAILNPIKTINKFSNCCEIIITNQDHFYKLSSDEISRIKEMEYTIPI